MKVGGAYPHGERQALVSGMDALRAVVGLPPDPGGAMLFRPLYVVNEPPSLQREDEPKPPTTVHLRRDVFDRSGPEARPVWLDGVEDRPTVYATMGTAYNKVPGLLEGILAALATSRST